MATLEQNWVIMYSAVDIKRSLKLLSQFYMMWIWCVRNYKYAAGNVTGAEIIMSTLQAT